MAVQPVTPKKVSKVFYMGSILLGIQVLPHAAMAFAASEMTMVGTLRGRLAEIYVFVSPAGIIYAGVVALFLLYRMWAAIRGEYARTTPGRAVGLLFVPVYNLFWLFQAVWGWTVDYNRFVSEHGLSAPKMPERLARAACILAVATAFVLVVPIPGFPGPVSPVALFAFPLALADALLFLIFLWKGCDGINALAESGGRPTTGRTSGMAVASVILGFTGLFACGLGPLVGLGLGIGALYEIRKGGGRIRGGELAKLGVVLCIGGLLLAFSLLPFTGPD